MTIIMANKWFFEPQAKAKDDLEEIVGSL